MDTFSHEHHAGLEGPHAPPKTISYDQRIMKRKTIQVIIAVCIVVALAIYAGAYYEWVGNLLQKLGAS